MLESFSTSTGQMLAQIEGIGTCLYQPKIVMAPGGTHAFVMCQGTGAQNFSSARRRGWALVSGIALGPSFCN